MPKEDVQWIVTSAGSLKLSWLKKISEYKEYDQVQLTYTTDNQTKSVNGTAKEVKVNSLRFGEKYTATLKDLATGTQTFTFSFYACKKKILRFIEANQAEKCFYF